MESYTSKQICEMLNITYKQITYWEEKGIIAPSLAEAKGSGSVRYYSTTDVRQFKVIKELKDMGISLQKIRRCLMTLRDFFPQLRYPLLDKAPFTDGKTVYILTENPAINIDILINRGQLVLFVPLKAWMEELKTIIENFEKKREEADREQREFYRWSEDLAQKRGLIPMTPEEVALITKERRKRRVAADA
jgi:DNA-binding transcriptional MerR regulator